MNNRYLLLHTEFTFDSAHRLTEYEGKCKNIHGHTWLVEAQIKGYVEQCDSIGILFDFSNVKKIKELYDHKLLNAIMLANPTAENIAINIYHLFKEINEDLMYKIRVYETAVRKETWCEYGDF